MFYKFYNYIPLLPDENLKEPTLLQSLKVSFLFSAALMLNSNRLYNESEGEEIKNYISSLIFFGSKPFMLIAYCIYMVFMRYNVKYLGALH